MAATAPTAEDRACRAHPDPHTHEAPSLTRAFAFPAGAATLRAQMQADARREARLREEAKARAALAKTVTQVARKVEETVDEELARLERVENMGDDELELLRERRLAQLKQQKERVERLRAQGHGQLVHVTDDKDFFAKAKQASKMVVHFSRASTRRCEILQKHLELLAAKHIGTLFIQVDAEKSPFLAERLKIHTLPSMVLCLNGKTEHTIIGFDELGGHDSFTTDELERVLYTRGVVEHAGSRHGLPSAHGKAVRSGNVDMDDWQD